jgi:hypothetical protein
MQKINNADNLIDLFLLDLNDIDLNGDITLWYQNI